MTENRKGARRRDDVTPELRDALNRGEAETISYVEMLVVDQRQLAQTVLPECGMDKLVDPVLNALDALGEAGISKVSRAIGESIAKSVSWSKSKTSRFQKLAQHQSDTVRGWACWVLASDQKLTLEQRLDATLPLAADSHWGVREIIWIAMRGPIESDLEDAIRLLSEWTSDADANVRRFAAEVTRPCGVWSRHIPRLKQEPELGLPILEPLRADDTKYVRDSVANWLNDASKTQPEWVIELCERWEQESETTQTQYVVRRAMRTIRKLAEKEAEITAEIASDPPQDHPQPD